MAVKKYFTTNGTTNDFIQALLMRSWQTALLLTSTETPFSLAGMTSPPKHRMNEAGLLLQRLRSFNRGALIIGNEFVAVGETAIAQVRLTCDF